MNASHHDVLEPERSIIPQAGPQLRFVETRADIAIMGGSKGGSKSYSLLIAALRWHRDAKFGAVIFRRTAPQILNQGGLWDTATDLFSGLATGYRQSLMWKFRSGARVRFAHLEHEDDRLQWGGTQIPFIGFDELQTFTARQFWYLLSCNRSPHGLPCRIRATCNPQSTGWLRELIDWWIDRDGWMIPERSGVIRHFVRRNDALEWLDQPVDGSTSFTFIRARTMDNPALLAADPGYIRRLESLPRHERLQLLGELDKGGNWNVMPEAGDYFRREFFEIADAAPADTIARVRYWDRAATPKRDGNDPDATAGVLMSRTRNGLFFVEDVRLMHAPAHEVESAMLAIAQQDGTGTAVAFAQDPGSAGKGEAEATARALAGFNVRFAPVTGDKPSRAKPFSAQCAARNVRLVRGAWNAAFMAEMENFSDTSNAHDDQVDAASGAFAELTAMGLPLERGSIIADPERLFVDRSRFIPTLTRR